MRVIYDPQTFLRQRTGGISRLFTDLIRAFDDDAALGVEPVLPYSWINNEHASADLPERRLHKTPHWLPRALLYAPWALRGLPQPREIDIVHHTYFSPRFLGPIGTAKRACTVYDMIPELFADTDAFTATHLSKREYVMASDLVICISESTRADMQLIYGDIPGTVVVVPAAIGPDFRPGLDPVEGLPHDYLLYVGARDGYKDFALLPQALGILSDRGHTAKLVVVGAPFTKSELATIDSFGLKDRIRQVSLGDSDLRRAYSNSLAVVQTSRYEGFGMPPLEGMASGVPVVIADASSMPEVGGDVARYFQPGDATSLADELEGLLAHSRLRAELGHRGQARARQFSALAMAEKTAAAYRSVTGSD